MGVTHLWPILQPTAKAIKLEDLKNKTLAVDLSIWLCETSLAKYNSEVLKPQLRNIFFLYTVRIPGERVFFPN